MKFTNRNNACLILLNVLILLISNGCQTAEKKTPVVSRVTNPVNIKMIDSAVTCLESGDLVFRLGSDMTSYILSQFNQFDKSYSHCGVVILENDRPFIYHCIGGEFNPDQKLKREPVKVWFSPENNLDIAAFRLKLDSLQRKRLVDNVTAYYKEEKKFDMEFDMTTDDRLYCAEMIYKAVIGAVGDTSYLPLTKALGREFVGVDNLFKNPNSGIIWQLRFK